MRAPKPWTRARYVSVWQRIRAGAMRKEIAEQEGCKGRSLRQALSKPLSREVEREIMRDDARVPSRDPELHVDRAEEGYHLRGVSSLLDANGELVQQWVKTARDPAADRQAQLLDAVGALIGRPGYDEIHAPVRAPRHASRDLLAVYPIADAHTGMFCWHRETGADYDVKTAERLHKAAIERLTACAPPADEALVVSLGDFFHCDNNLSRTMRSGNPLDTDTRWPLVLRVGMRMMVFAIEAALRRHRRVRVIVEIGNHDDQSAFALALLLEAMFRAEPRVVVDTSEEPYHWYRFGACLIGTTHGGAAKITDLPGVMSVDRAKDWGETRYRYWYTGHVHHESVIEAPGCTVESFRTLAPRDAYTHRSGYRADRDMRVDVLHRRFGRITRHILGVEQLAA